MKVLIAMDSFKGSLSSREAGEAVREGIRRAWGTAPGGTGGPETVIVPVADGGEGTTESLVEGLGGTFREVPVTGPDGKTVTARYGILPDGETVVMEMAQAAGITLISPGRQEPWHATTYGVGEMIQDAVLAGGRNFIIGIGGSATTDGGTGMLAALGLRFLDRENRPVGAGIAELDRIETIDTAGMLPELAACSFQIACDVKHPLCGENGAVYVYGPQKGVKEEEKPVLDEKMRHYAEKTREVTGKDCSQEEGAGAAGGLGFAFLSWFPHAVLKPGVEIVLDAVNLEPQIRDADLVVTGEGRLDGQTAMGKLPAGVAALAKKHGKTVLAFAGSVTPDAGRCNETGIDAFFPAVRGVTTLEEAMKPETARQNLSLSAEQAFRLVRSVSRYSSQPS